MALTLVVRRGTANGAFQPPLRCSAAGELSAQCRGQRIAWDLQGSQTGVASPSVVAGPATTAAAELTTRLGSPALVSWRDAGGSRRIRTLPDDAKVSVVWSDTDAGETRVWVAFAGATHGSAVWMFQGSNRKIFPLPQERWERGSALYRGSNHEGDLLVRPNTVLSFSHLGGGINHVVCATAGGDFFVLTGVPAPAALGYTLNDTRSSRFDGTPGFRCTALLGWGNILFAATEGAVRVLRVGASLDYEVVARCNDLGEGDVVAMAWHETSRTLVCLADRELTVVRFTDDWHTETVRPVVTEYC